MLAQIEGIDDNRIMNTTNNTLNTSDTMTELALIARGEHPAWKGDAARNAESFVWRIANDMPDEARALADDLENNIGAVCEETGLPPRRVLITIRILRGE